MMGECTLYTKRLVLREITEKDSKQIVSLRSNPYVYQYFKNPHKLTMSEHLRWYNDIYLHDNSLISWIGFLCNRGLEDSKPDSISVIGLFQAKKENDSTAELSYLVSEQYQGCGYASEALSEIEIWVRNNWHVEYALVEIHKDNVKSICFAKSMGFERVDDFEIYKKVLK